ncbi:DEAD/DEAH box helicase [Nesterenkonia sp. K-15-9-6]|uniref:DEAD/DEAH box helicase n=1 Tax=Nesterenkonia sp. K-15-9-6 TaxID=3093918 RepID=UPI004044AF2A
MIEYELRPYQAKAAADVLKHVHMGMAEPGELVTTLSAPTGAGKTIIAASAIDELLHGSDTSSGDLGLVILWVSMSPQLNEQTAEKFARASSKLADRTRVIDASEEFDGPSLAPGHVYFLNPQKLGRGARTYRAGNHRRRDLWDTLNGTVERHGSKVLVFVDEAHQGTRETSNGDATLLAQFLNGTGKGKRRAPVVVGISATPGRFEKSLSSRSMKMSVTVDIGDVREGGLVKDHVLLGHPDEEIAADTTLLMEATRKRLEMAHLWREYTDANDEPTVEPILLVQLPANVSEQTVSGWLDAIRETDTQLTKRNIANALQDHTTITWGQHDVRYVEPSRIQETSDVKVVLFKDALTTGWDCPRAEVLVSMRSTEDATTIAQLIGRTVRTPLAKRVTNRELGDVTVYLPHFRQDTVQQIIEHLRDGDDAVASETITSPVRVAPNPDLPQGVVDAFEALPTWSRPAKTARSTVSRLVKAAAVLHQHQVQDDALEVARKRVVSALLAHLDANRDWVEQKIEQYTEVEYVTRVFDWMTGEETGQTSGSLEIATSNVLDLYKQAKSRLPDASAAWLWEHFANEETFDDLAEARLAVAALAQHPDTVRTVEDAARTLLSTWKQEHLGELALLGGQAQEDFLTVFTESTRSEQLSLINPTAANIADAPTRWRRHLLVCDDGTYPLDVSKNTWERRVLETEVERETTIAWYRNPTGGRHALAIPYGEPGEQSMLYPDFLVFAEREGALAVSILDPHRPDLGDTLPKWIALAQYAHDNGDLLDRVWAVIDDGADNLLFLDLRTTIAVNALRDAETAGGGENRIREAFAKAGGRYR